MGSEGWWGKAVTGQGTEDGGTGCPCSLHVTDRCPSLYRTELPYLPGHIWGKGPRAGQGQTQSSCAPPLPKIPEALGSFPNEALEKTLPN